MWHGVCCVLVAIVNEDMVMKVINTVILAGILVVNQAAAAEVVRETDDNVAGAAFGSASGMLVGGAVTGGPVGALVGLGVGLFVGKFAQQKSGLSQKAYVVKTDSGDLKTVRSHGLSFNPGDQVVVSGNRLK